MKNLILRYLNLFVLFVIGCLLGQFVLCKFVKADDKLPHFVNTSNFYATQGKNLSSFGLVYSHCVAEDVKASIVYIPPSTVQNMQSGLNASQGRVSAKITFSL